MAVTRIEKKQPATSSAPEVVQATEASEVASPATGGKWLAPFNEVENEWHFEVQDAVGRRIECRSLTEMQKIRLNAIIPQGTIDEDRYKLQMYASVRSINDDAVSVPATEKELAFLVDNRLKRAGCAAVIGFYVSEFARMKELENTETAEEVKK
jgi:hypothetical protein